MKRLRNKIISAMGLSLPAQPKASRVGSEAPRPPNETFVATDQSDGYDYSAYEQAEPGSWKEGLLAAKRRALIARVVAHMQNLVLASAFSAWARVSLSLPSSPASSSGPASARSVDSEAERRGTTPAESAVTRCSSVSGAEKRDAQLEENKGDNPVNTADHSVADVCEARLSKDATPDSETPCAAADTISIKKGQATATSSAPNNPPQPLPMARPNAAENSSGSTMGTGGNGPANTEPPTATIAASPGSCALAIPEPTEGVDEQKQVRSVTDETGRRPEETGFECGAEQVRPAGSTTLQQPDGQAVPEGNANLRGGDEQEPSLVEQSALKQSQQEQSAQEQGLQEPSKQSRQQQNRQEQSWQDQGQQMQGQQVQDQQQQSLQEPSQQKHVRPEQSQQEQGRQEHDREEAAAEEQQREQERHRAPLPPCSASQSTRHQSPPQGPPPQAAQQPAQPSQQQSPHHQDPARHPAAVRLPDAGPTNSPGTPPPAACRPRSV